MNILLLGRTGAGKSLLGNVLTGRETFKVSNGSTSCTTETQSEISDCGSFKVYDTQGAFGTEEVKEKKSVVEMNEIMMENIINTLQDFSNGNEVMHAVLLVHNMKKKLSSLDESFAKSIGNLFFEHAGEEIYIIITNADEKYSNSREKCIKWLMTEQADSESSFNSYYTLVKNNPDKVVFVNDKNGTEYKEKNAIMAQKVISGVRETTGTGFSIPMACLIRSKQSIDEAIKQEKQNMNHNLERMRELGNVHFVLRCEYDSPSNESNSL